MAGTDIYDRTKAPAIIRGMASVDLLDYVERRLRGLSTRPPLDQRSEEHPSYVLEKAYERSPDGQFKKRFELSIARLLAREQITVSNPDYVATLLRLCERFKIEDASAPIAGMIVKGDLKTIDSQYGNLHDLALRAFSRLEKSKMITAIWEESIYDTRFTATCFAALSSQGLDVILPHIVDFVSVANKDNEAINLKISLGSLYEHYKGQLSASELSQILWREIEDQESDSKNHVLSIIRVFDPAFKTQEKEEKGEASIISPAVLYRVAVQLFKTGKIALAELLLKYLPHRNQRSYFLGWLYLSRLDITGALKHFSSAFESGLTEKDALSVQRALPRGIGTKTQLVSLMTTLDEETPYGSLAAKLAILAGWWKDDTVRRKKWERIAESYK